MSRRILTKFGTLATILRDGRILSHCGLDWEESCRRFHLTRRPVKTANASPVRAPLYGAAVGRSQPYRAMMAPLLDALGIERTT